MSTKEKAISFLPNPILHWINDDILEKRFDAVVAFADVSGFTKMSEQLAAIGKEGAEALTGILNSYFTQMIRRIESAGGFVGKFGGDAMTIFFPVNEHETMEEVSARAIKTALSLQDKMIDFQAVETRGGTFALGMKIGIAAGDVLHRVVGYDTKGGKEYLLAGVPLDRAAEAEHHGVAGQVVITPKVAGMVEVRGEKLDDGFVIVDPDASVDTNEYSAPAEETNIEKLINISEHFIDPPVFNRIALGMDSVGEIRRVSVIFMSFTGLNYVEDEQVGDKLSQIFDWVYGLTSRYGGSINKVDMGDKGSKMIITFGAPTAHENDEELAIHCGLQLVKGQEKIKQMGVEQRIGIATGVVFTGEVGAPSRQEYTVMGSVVNLSARIMAYSKPGQLIVDPVTQEKSCKTFEFAEPDYVQFKGIKDPLPVYRVKGLKSTPQKEEQSDIIQLIGRNDEILNAQSILDEVIDGNLRTLIVRGDPGLGKSRLALEIIGFARQHNFTISAGEALTYAKRSPYLIWNSILRKLLGLPAAGGGKDTLNKLEAVIAQADPQNTFRLPIVASALGIECPDNDTTKYFDAQLRQENLFDFVFQFLKYNTAQNPVLILFEDVQWIDRNSLALMAYLQRNLEQYPVFFLIARRSYHRKFICEHIGEIEGNECTSLINLKEFNLDETRQFILQIFDANSIEEELLKFIFDSSHGNPSFTEQLIQNLKSLDKLQTVVEGEKKETTVCKKGDLSEVEVPDSLSSLIMSQLDRLEPEAKLTVKVAAVIGRQFQREIIENSYPVEMPHEQIIQSLEELKTLDLIKASQDTDVFDYIFKNILTQDVAYDSLLFAHRREYHRRIGISLEDLYNESLTEWYEDLARHFSSSDDDVRAISYLGKAGDKSYGLYANDSAESYYSKAIERAEAEEFKREKYNLLKMRSSVFSVVGKNDEHREDLDSMLALTLELDDPDEKADTLFRYCLYHYHNLESEEMEAKLNEAEQVVKQVDDPKVNITLYGSKGNFNFLNKNYQEALKNYEEAARYAEENNDQAWLSANLTNCGLVFKTIGDFKNAIEYYNRSLNIDKQTGNKKSEAVNLRNIGVLSYAQGKIDDALSAFTGAFEIAKSIGSKQLQSENIHNLAYLYQMKGDRQKALNLFEDNYQLVRQAGSIRGQIAALDHIGTWYLEYGDFDKALSYYDQALTLVTKNNLSEFESQKITNIGLALHYKKKYPEAVEMLKKAVQLSIERQNSTIQDYSRRYLGFVYLDLGKIEEAENEFKEAGKVAESLGSKISLAGYKIGKGIVDYHRTGSKDLWQEGINEVRQLGDRETFIKGNIFMGKACMDKDSDLGWALENLEMTLGIAVKSGYRCDVGLIEPMIKTLKQKLNKE